MTSTTMPLALSITRSTSVFRQILLVLGASVLLSLSAKIQVPFWPVPMTMQSYMVLVLGMALGPRLGPAAVAAYLAQGALGLPVFAGTPEKGIGLAYMTGPTGGYLLGFFVAAIVTGQCAARGFDRRWPYALLTATAGMAVIFACGLLWLSSLIGVDKAIQFGAAPFALGALLKILLAMLTLPLAWRLLGRRDHLPDGSNDDAPTDKH
jgi:biotin transport system substrate-specific component